MWACTHTDTWCFPLNAIACSRGADLESFHLMTQPKLIPAYPVGLSARWDLYPQTKRNIPWG